MSSALRHWYGKIPALQALPVLLLFLGIFLLTQAVQTDFGSIALGYGTAFVGFFLLISGGKIEKLSHILLLAVGLRLVCFVALPNLSDDYFRFIWDGKCTTHDISPFAQLPSELIQNEDFTSAWQASEALEQMNSKDYYSVYPPTSQLVYWLASYFGLSGGAQFIRLVLLLADLGSILLLFRLLPQFGKSNRKALLFAVNPLVIFEFTGNLHFEGLMIFFGLLALWFFKKKKWLGFAISLAVSIGVKLIPLLLLPFFFRKFKPLRAIGWGALVGLLVVLSFLPFIDQSVIQNFGKSLDLYFRKFEFNASVYYIIRYIGTAVKGWNPIGTIGPALSLVVLVGVLSLAFIKKGFAKPTFVAMALALTLHLALSTTIHPWYISTVFAIALFTNLRYATLWTATAVLSYFFYHNGALQENSWILLLEYLPVLALLVLDLRKPDKVIIA